MSWIPLLSPRSLDQYTAHEYKDYVKSLYFKPPPAKSTEIKLKLPFTWRLNAKGTLCLKVNRKPKWLSREEIDQIARESKIPASKVWLKVCAKKSGIRISSAEAETKLKEIA